MARCSVKAPIHVIFFLAICRFACSFSKTSCKPYHFLLFCSYYHNGMLSPFCLLIFNAVLHMVVFVWSAKIAVFVTVIDIVPYVVDIFDAFIPFGQVLCLVPVSNFDCVPKSIYRYFVSQQARSMTNYRPGTLVFPFLTA